MPIFARHRPHFLPCFIECFYNVIWKRSFLQIDHVLFDVFCARWFQVLAS